VMFDYSWRLYSSEPIGVAAARRAHGFAGASSSPLVVAAVTALASASVALAACLPEASVYAGPRAREPRELIAWFVMFDYSWRLYSHGFAGASSSPLVVAAVTALASASVALAASSTPW
jgi:hypothetical protein